MGADPAETGSPLEVMEGGTLMKAADLRAALGVSRTTLSRLLKPLITSGQVVREGVGASTRYRLAGCSASPPIRNVRWEVAIAMARNEGRVTRGRLAAELGVSERTALRVLAAMVEAGVFIEDGRRGRRAGYTAVP